MLSTSTDNECQGITEEYSETSDNAKAKRRVINQISSSNQQSIFGENGKDEDTSSLSTTATTTISTPGIKVGTKWIVELETAENLSSLLESLNCTITKLIEVYESVKPMVHFNIAYDLRYFNGKTGKLRSTDFIVRRKLASIALPTGGWFGVFLFKRHIRKMFKVLLSTCDLCLLVKMENSCSIQEDRLKEINTNITKKIIKIRANVINNSEELTKRKASHRAEHINMALQIAGAIIAIASISWLQQYAPVIGSSIKSYPVWDLCAKNISWLLYIPTAAIISTWIGPKLMWYKRVINFSQLKDKEKDVYKSLEKVLRFLVKENAEVEKLIL